MTTDRRTAAHWSFWAIAVVSLVWNGLGAMNFFAQMDPELLAGYPAAERMVVEARPAWATAGFAVAVFGGTLGSALLLLRKTWAVYAFAASLLGVALAAAHAASVAGNAEAPAPVLIGAGLSLALAVFLIWYTRQARRRGWIA